MTAIDKSEPGSFLSRAAKELARRGVAGSLRRGVFLLRRRVSLRWIPVHPFDGEHGVRTGGLLTQTDLSSGHKHDAQITAYYGTQPSTFRGGMARWRDAVAKSGESFEDFTFVDIGCGKGRVLMLASEFPFRRVVGLELNPAIADQGRENLKHWSSKPHPCEDLEIITGDVMDFNLPVGPTLLFMYNPFEGELFKSWVQKVAFSLGERVAPMYLLYIYPRYEEHLKLLPNAELLWFGEVPMTSAEMATDWFGCTFEHVSLYRLSSPA